MTRRYMVHKHPHVITATKIQPMGSTGVVEQVLRFQSLDALIGHFSGLGVPPKTLEVVRRSVDSTGMATLVVFEGAKR